MNPRNPWIRTPRTLCSYSRNPTLYAGLFVFFLMLLTTSLPLLAGESLLRLEDVEKIGTGILKGPEDVAMDKEGNLYAGCLDGVICKVSPQGNISSFVDTKGRPLGLFFQENGNLLVCDGKRKEALSVTPEGEIRGLISRLPLALLPSGQGEGMVLKVRGDRTVEVLLSDLKGEKIPSVTNVIDTGDLYYMGFLYYGDGIARIRKPEQPAK